MTTADRITDIPATTPRTAKEVWLARFEMLLERAGEQLNPILVKEARQALKSRQFMITFTLLLLFGWGWSLIGIAVGSPGIYYLPSGRFMLIAYYVILSVPLMVIVPFSAFRSLAAEREDGTFELLSITSLSSRQIVYGKLGSAMLQMLVYYSALSPCVAFTYLLRGIDIVSILLLLTYTFAASVLLSAIGLLCATATRLRHWQVFLSVILLIGLVAGGFFIFMGISAATIFQSNLPVDQPDFWIGNLAGLTFYLSFLALFLRAAASQISFASDNRSTPLRAVMVVQQTLLIGWSVYLWMRVETGEVLYVMSTVAVIYWAIIGAMLCGEMAQLSPRVRRSLPQSFLGRATLTWFNPGSGTGYMFAILNMATLTIVVAVAFVSAERMAFAGMPSDDYWPWLLSMLLAYLIIYLGITRLIVIGLRRFVDAGIAVSLLVGVLVTLAGCAVPLFFEMWIRDFRDVDYSTLQASNWWWTFLVIVDDELMLYPAVPLLVFASAAGMLVLHGVLIAREVEHVRVATPQRVLEDELELHPERLAKIAAAKGPWDE